MHERTYRLIKGVAVLMVGAWIAWSLYDWLIAERHPYQRELSAAARYLEDGRPEDALTEYDGILNQDPGNAFALRGRAQSLLQLGRSDEALGEYDRAIRREHEAGIDEGNRTVLGVLYAQRGILKDRMGDYPGAVADYQQAMALEPETAEGPGWLTRFLRNQPDTPPTIAERARYLRDQLAKPEDERLLRVPEQDTAQRSYTM